MMFKNGMVSGCVHNNGWCSTIKSLASLSLNNTDGVGRADAYDIDSDNDGITDAITSKHNLPAAMSCQMMQMQMVMELTMYMIFISASVAMVLRHMILIAITFPIIWMMTQTMTMRGS